MKSKLVLIGNGMAGARFLEELTGLAHDKYEIAVFGDEPWGNYNRILLPGLLAGEYKPEDIVINPPSWYADRQIRLHAGVRALQIDRRQQVVIGSNGVLEPYDILVLATGGEALIPPIQGVRGPDGNLQPGAFTFRSLRDYQLIQASLPTCRRAVVLGGGLLGLEAAHSLRQRGLEVDLVHHSMKLMSKQLDEGGSATLRRLVEASGIRLHMPKRAIKVACTTRIEGLIFEDGTELSCDLLLIATGIKPNVELAKEADLHVDRGIIVHDDLSAHNDPHIYALGECAQHRGITYGLVAPAWEMARVLAERLSGVNPQAAYHGSLVSTKLKVAGIEVASLGLAEPQSSEDEVVSYCEPRRGVYKKLVIRGDKLIGGVLIGDGRVLPRLLRCFDRQVKLPTDRSELLFNLSSESPGHVTDLPDDAQVCNCNGVSKGQIVEAVRKGCRTLKAVCDSTRAGTGCGSCKAEVQALLEMAAGGEVAEDPSIHYYVPGIPMTKPELVAAIKERGLKSVSDVFKELAGGVEDPASKPGLASLLKTVWGKDYIDERDARFINDRVHANIQKDGTFSVVPRIYGGVTTPAELKRIAEVAQKYDVPLVKLTGGQRIDLLGIPREKLPDIWRDLGMPSGHAYTKAFRTCKTCVGSDFCRYGLGDSIGLGIAIEKRFQGIEAPAKMKLAAAGCPRNCSEATTKDVGVVAVEGGKWEIYVGGAAGSRVRKGDLLCTVTSHEEVLKYIGRFIQYYREHAKYQERSYDFVERVGIEKLRQVLVEDSEGICWRLDEDIQAAIEAYVDPWLEAIKPHHPLQFVSKLTPVSKEVESK